MFSVNDVVIVKDEFSWYMAIVTKVTPSYVVADHHGKEFKFTPKANVNSVKLLHGFKGKIDKDAMTLSQANVLATKYKQAAPSQGKPTKDVEKQIHVDLSGFEKHFELLKKEGENKNREREALIVSLWEELNRKKFSSRLKKCKFEVMKDEGINFRLRGSWHPKYRRISLARRLFNADFDTFVEILLHEMCHQAVTDIDLVMVEKVNAGHGPLWEAHMRSVGLKPEQFDHRESDVYMDEVEKFDKQVEDIHREEMNIKLAVWDLRPNMAVKIISKGEESFGLLVGTRSKNGTWDVVTDPSGGFYMSVPVSALYSAGDREFEESFYTIAERIRHSKGGTSEDV